MQKTAIVLGASGLVGSALVNQLTEAGQIEKIVTLTRRPIEHASPKVVNQVIDFEQLESYGDLFKGDYLFSCLGTTKKAAGSVAAQRKVDVDYQLIAAQLASNKGVPHYLLVSSMGANATSSSPYLKMKGELEQQVSQLPFQRISILRPSLLMGDRDEFRIGEKAASWLMPVFCKLPGLGRYKPITGDQVAKRMLLQTVTVGQGIEYFELDEVFIEQ